MIDKFVANTYISKMVNNLEDEELKLFLEWLTTYSTSRNISFNLLVNQLQMEIMSRPCFEDYRKLIESTVDKNYQFLNGR